jgi:hypothetical protein
MVANATASKAKANANASTISQVVTSTSPKGLNSAPIKTTQVQTPPQAKINNPPNNQAIRKVENSSIPTPQAVTPPASEQVGKVLTKNEKQFVTKKLEEKLQTKTTLEKKDIENLENDYPEYKGLSKKLKAELQDGKITNDELKNLDPNNNNENLDKNKTTKLNANEFKLLKEELKNKTNLTPEEFKEAMSEANTNKSPEELDSLYKNLSRDNQKLDFNDLDSAFPRNLSPEDKQAQDAVREYTGEDGLNLPPPPESSSSNSSQKGSSLDRNASGPSENIDPSQYSNIEEPKIDVSQFNPKTRAAIQKIISKYAPNAPVKAEQLMLSSKTTGTPILAYLVMAVSESHFGTAGRAAYTKNVYNVGNVDNGSNKFHGTWQAGLDNFGSLMAKSYLKPDELNGQPNSDKAMKGFIQRDFRRISDNARYMTDPTAQSKIIGLTRDISKMLVNELGSGANIDS